MASAKTHIRKSGQSRNLALFFVIALILGVAGFVLSFVLVNNAQGSGDVDASVIGVGSKQAVLADTDISAQERAMGTSSAASVASEATDATVDPQSTAQRSITVKDPDPVVVPVAVDASNPEAVAKAKEVCTLDPLPTAPHVAPDVNDGSWQVGSASAYDVVSNDDGKGNFGVTTTASGVGLHSESVTVAVPESEAYRLGQVVEICYDGKVVIATVTDTGGFARYGRALDLAPGVSKAFGASSVKDWGVRSVHYRFL